MFSPANAITAGALVAMESSGHCWMALAAHLRRQGIPVALVSPLRRRLGEGR